MRDSFVFYRSFYEALEGIPNDVKLEIYEAIMQYGLYGINPENLSPYANLAIKLIFPLIDKNNQRYQNGCHGGRKRNSEKNEAENKPSENRAETETKPNKNQIETKTEPYDNVNDNVNDNDNDNEVACDEENVPAVIDKVDYRGIVEAFNVMLSPPLPTVIKLTESRKKAIKARYTEHGLDAIETVFNKVQLSSFLKGANGGWSCDFDWIFKPNNFIKILEGNYDDGYRNTSISEKERANEYLIRKTISEREHASEEVGSEMGDPF